MVSVLELGYTIVDIYYALDKMLNVNAPKENDIRCYVRNNSLGRYYEVRDGKGKALIISNNDLEKLVDGMNIGVRVDKLIKKIKKIPFYEESIKSHSLECDDSLTSKESLILEYH